MNWERFYHDQLQERWPSLREALGREPQTVARFTRFALNHGAQLPPKPEILQLCYEHEGLPQALGESGLYDFYRMDLASIVAARALGVKTGERVLDLCSAPGGKALILAEALAEGGELTVNDLSQARLERLKRVLRQYLPSEILERVEITHYDGARFGLHRGGEYDRVLLDAPCSGERQLWMSATLREQWSPARTRHLQARQYALLCAALDAVKVGGEIVYSTCSVLRGENDAIIEKLQKKRTSQFEILPADEEGARWGERTACGVQIWPDRAGGYGPIFYARLRKTAVSK